MLKGSSVGFPGLSVGTRMRIRFLNMGLRGEFPRGVSNCLSMTGLDLLNNELYGKIPETINKLLGFLTSLDLSSNNFSGSIPVNLTRCIYLNTLRLDHIRLMGQIPPELGQLDRLKTFSVAYNFLSVQTPRFINCTYSADSFANNQGLYGETLGPCRAASKSTHPGVIGGAAIGGVTAAAIAVGIGMHFCIRRVSWNKQKDDDPDGNKWAKNLKGSKNIKVSLFEKTTKKMKFSDLLKATNTFNKNNIIGSGRTGAMYKAVLEDGTALMINRLHDSQHSEKEFMAEMATLGNVKHRNLVSLLGFCVAKERLLVYEYVPKGTLYDRLHSMDDGSKIMDWPLRLKIAIGAVRGFAWLHHNCNPRILHRNISSKCILLDSDFEPKISEYCLARLMNPIDTHLSTFVNCDFGDLGYVAPEYARTVVATPKGDVYSFGTVLLELVTGEKLTYVTRAAESFRGNLAEWVTQLSSNGRLQDAIDRSLVGKGVDNEVFQFLKVSCNCVLPMPKERPTMFEVYQFLRAIGEGYDFTADDGILMAPEDLGKADFIEELIVAREVRGEE